MFQKFLVRIFISEGNLNLYFSDFFVDDAKRLKHTFVLKFFNIFHVVITLNKTIRRRWLED